MLLGVRGVCRVKQLFYRQIRDSSLHLPSTPPLTPEHSMSLPRPSHAIGEASGIVAQLQLCKQGLNSPIKDLLV